MLDKAQGVDVLVLPGCQSSGPQHWQSRWEAIYGDQRVEQHDWWHPLRGDWMARLEEVLLQCSRPAILVAHSLGCLLVAAWSAHTHNHQLVRGALLVAPGDAASQALRPVLGNWSSIALQELPFPSIMVASRNDPYCSFERASLFAKAWGSVLVDGGNRGHLNAESGLGAWPQGRQLVRQLASEQAFCAVNI